jgi:hypothetical protein
VEPSTLYVIPDSIGAVMVMVPVANEHVGCVNETVGAAGAVGCALITTLADAAEVHPEALVTVKV